MKANRMRNMPGIQTAFFLNLNQVLGLILHLAPSQEYKAVYFVGTCALSTLINGSLNIG
jgi:hypothetical protein